MQYHLNLTKANEVELANDEHNHPTENGLLQGSGHDESNHQRAVSMYNKIRLDMNFSASALAFNPDASEHNNGQSQTTVYPVTSHLLQRLMKDTDTALSTDSSLIDAWHRNRDLKSVENKNLSIHSTKIIPEMPWSKQINIDHNVVKNHQRRSVLLSDSSVKWEVYYRASEAYFLTRLDALNMRQLYSNLEHDEKLFNEYYLRNAAGIDNGPCDDTCKRNHLCSIVNLRVRELFKCARYNTTYFRDLLRKTFKHLNVNDYTQYFENDIESHVTETIPTESDAHADVDIHVTLLEVTQINTVEVEVPQGGHELSITDNSNEHSAHVDTTEDTLDESKAAGDVSSNITNPHSGLDQLAMSHINDGGGGEVAVGVGLGMPVVIMIGCVGVFWVILALLFGAVRWRRSYRARARAAGGGVAMFSARPSHDGYTPIYGEEH